MIRLSRLAPGCSLFCLLATFTLAASAAPVITSVSPGTALAGQTITVTGSGFGATQGSSYVLFSDAGINWGAPVDAATWSISSWSNTQITFAVPNPSGPSGQYAVVSNTTATVTVTVAGQASNSANIAIGGGLVITSVSPGTALAGQTITVTGSGFGATQGSSYVLFSDAGTNWGAPVDAGTWSISSWSNTQITFAVPNPSGPSGQYAVVPNTTATVTVTVAGQTSNSENIAIAGNPVITSVSPGTALAGQTITVTGSGFGATQGSSYVLFSDAGTNWGAPVDAGTWSISSWSNTQITFAVPNPSGPSGQYAVVPNTTATVNVTVAGKTSNSENIAIGGGPVITSVSPGTALAGQTITVTGSGFGATQGSSYVLFSDAGTNWGAPVDAATWSISSWSNTQITFAVPNPSGPSGQYAVVPNTTATVTVTVAGKTSNSANIAIGGGLVITSVSPGTALAGQTITVTGSGFGATQGSSYVLFSDAGTNWGAPVDAGTWSISSWSNTQITFAVPNPSGPSGQYAVVPNTTATVTVTVAGQTSNSENIAIGGGLVITSLSPGTALAGQTITVTGSGFGATQGSSYVLFSDAGTNWGAPADAATWSISSWSNTQITFAVPNPSGPSDQYAVVPNTMAKVTVTVAGETSNSENIAIITQPVNWYTRSFNLPRTGANLNESILTPANVNSTQFGKLFTVSTDGEIFAQPLYVSDLTIAGAVHNAVFVATMNNSIYAIDADNGAILWTQNYGTPIVAKEVENDQNIAWISGIGILSTPVIDPSTNYMYFVHGTELSGASHEYQLEAIDITTGNRVFNPTTISATYTADATSPVTFSATMQNQRTSLALANGNIYFAFGSHEDQYPYQGWVFAYSASTLAQVAVYADQTEGSAGGIWMAGSAIAIDVSGNLYLSSGNGTFGATPSGLMQTGSSFIKLSPTLKLLDYFTPSNSATLNANDMDLGSGGVLLVPNASNPQGASTYVAGGGKEGILYLANPNNLGKFNASQDQVVQEFQAIYGTGTSHIHGTPVYFDSAVNGPSLYIWGENDYLRGFQFNATGGLLTTAPFAESTMTAPVTNAYGAMPGGFLSISANGGTNGIVWASTPYSGDALKNIVQGVVYAFNANTLQKLWSDKDNDARDEIGLFAKYCPPIVVNGKLYMATFGPLATGTTTASGQLVVYGLLPQQ